VNASLRIIRNDLLWYEQQIVKSELGRRRTFFQRTVYPWFQRKAFEQFKTAGRSEGKSWRIRDEHWKEVKLQKRKQNPAKYPGGDRPAVYTGRLMGAISGLSAPEFYMSVDGATSYHNKLVGKSLVVTASLPYAKPVDEMYDITTLSKATIDELEEMVAQYWQKEAAR
jgi:hypothetical protein